MTNPPWETGCHQGGWYDILVDNVLKILKGKGKSLRNTILKRGYCAIEWWTLKEEIENLQKSGTQMQKRDIWFAASEFAPQETFDLVWRHFWLSYLEGGQLGIWWAEARDAANTLQHIGQPCNRGTWPSRDPGVGQAASALARCCWPTACATACVFTKLCVGSVSHLRADGRV